MIDGVQVTGSFRAPTGTLRINLGTYGPFRVDSFGHCGSTMVMR